MQHTITRFITTTMALTPKAEGPLMELKERARLLWEQDAFLTVPEIARVLEMDRVQLVLWAEEEKWACRGPGLKPYVWTPRDHDRELRENPEAWKIHCELFRQLKLPGVWAEIDQ